MKSVLSILAILLLISPAATRAADPGTPRKPNILLIVADDMGYGDPGCYNAKSKIATPNIDPTTPTEWPSNRHQTRTSIMFADGHAESVRRKDVISSTSDLWRRRWNNDNLPHYESAWSVNVAQEARIDP